MNYSKEFSLEPEIRYDKTGVAHYNTSPAGVPPLLTISAIELQNKVLAPIRFTVAGMFPQGLCLLCSPPKFGKSWFVLDMCLKVACGKRFLDRETAQSGCLYLALEDSENRLQSRMKKLLNGLPAPSGFDFTIKSLTINDGLLQQLSEYVSVKPDTKLIVIDTLQKVRTNTRISATYGGDYESAGALKSFADKHGICLLLVHHTRKTKDESDVFNTVSGTTGITGAADTTIVLAKDKRKGKQVLLSITGRDVEQDELMLELDENFRWHITGSGEDYEALRAEAHRPADERSEAEDFLTDFLDGSEKPSKSIFQAADERGISKRTLVRAKTDLKIQSFQRGRVWYWAENEPKTSERHNYYSTSTNGNVSSETLDEAHILLHLSEDCNSIASETMCTYGNVNSDDLAGRGTHALFENEED
jgi:hypothetical protein